MDVTFYEGEITFSHREKIEEIRRRNRHVLSSHAFSSLWLWRKQMGLSLYLEEGLFAVRAAKYGADTWFFPCGTAERKLAFIRKHLGGEDFSLCYLREEDVQFLEEHFPGRFETKPAPDASEYLYGRKEMEAMAGGKFSNMRKQINKLRKAYDVRTEKIDDGNLEAAVGLLHKYFFREQIPGYYALKDDGIAEEALRHRESLGLFGVLVYLDGKPESFALGFGLTEDTVDGCIEKHGGEISGISYLTQREFFLSSPAQYRFMNGEEDMGLPGLCAMKRHMVPVRKNELWEAKKIRNRGVTVQPEAERLHHGALEIND